MNHCTTKNRGAWHKPVVSQCRPTFHNPEQTQQTIVFERYFLSNRSNYGRFPGGLLT
jgi:hypothetical protein